MKIAILGGSFDPIHYGHLAIAHTALERLQCDQVWFLPSHDTPLKEKKQTEAHHRVAMLERAIQGVPAFAICDAEIRRKGVSYTVDTLRELIRLYPEDSFVWLIGNDQLRQFSQWKDADQLVKMAQFVCVDRDGQLDETTYPIQRITMEPVPVSSSQIRLGQRLNYVPESVLEYMYQHELYLEGFVQSRVTKKRFQHSCSVADLCRQFARANQYDEHKAYLAGLFHDIAKSMKREEMEPWMDILCPANKDYPVAVWHGFVGSEIVDRIFGLRDPDLKEAIYHHVLGTSTNPYAMMVFCADKTDPLRGYDSGDMIRACMENLEQGFHYVKEENERYLRKGN